MKTIAAVLSLMCLPSLVAFAEPPTSDQILGEAKAKASAENKSVFLHFGASWCGWCKRLDAFLERSDIKPVFEKNFVPVKLVVQENEKNKALENPGADTLMKNFGGPDGLPFHRSHAPALERKGLANSWMSNICSLPEVSM